MKFGAGHGGPNGAVNGPFGQPPSALNQNAQSQPSTQQLRMLVQQIQMAVQHGYLNHQILNQPLAPQTLLLLNQMLNHIKVRNTIIAFSMVYYSLSSGKTGNFFFECNRFCQADNLTVSTNFLKIKFKNNSHHIFLHFSG